jgi:hypothetical protein
VITEFADGYLVASVISGRAWPRRGRPPATATSGVVGYETAMLVERVGPVLTPELITELKTSLAL